MKLYFSPGACCMSCHIALEETKIPFELVYVGKNADPEVRAEFLKLNPLGAVPALEFDNKNVLTQNIAILEYVADQKPETKLLAPAGSFERAETMKWLSLIASDLHKAFAPLFALNKITDKPETQNEIKKWCLASIDKYLTIIENHLQNRQYLVGNDLTVADCYLFTVYQWMRAINQPTDKYPALNRYSAMLAKRPSIMAVHEREHQASQVS